jgi:hypothetical protein
MTSQAKIKGTARLRYLLAMLDDTLRHRSKPNLSRELWKREHGEAITQFGVEGLEITVAFAELPRASPASDFESVRCILLKILRRNDTDIKHATSSGMLARSVHGDDAILEPRTCERTTEAETKKCNQLGSIASKGLSTKIRHDKLEDGAIKVRDKIVVRVCIGCVRAASSTCRSASATPQPAAVNFSRGMNTKTVLFLQEQGGRASVSQSH